MKQILTLLILFAMAVGSNATEIVYRIAEYNNNTQSFILSCCGEKPQGSEAEFVNDYGATSGNRYNQIPRNREARLYLYGWKGCKINNVTFSMCSNNKSGTVGYSITDGSDVIIKQNPVDFNSESWYGQWVSKDLGVYVDITKSVDSDALVSDEACIIVKAGTSEGSVYLNSITIDYEAPQGQPTESAMPYKFEKLDKNSVIAQGDVVMLYRNGCAAADYDGMETSKYLDGVPLKSATEVSDPDVELFTLSKTDGGKWTLTDQYGRVLGATGKQSLAWNNGLTSWSISLTFEGAKISSENDNYGTIRYNAPDGGYPRFWNYTSTSLPLPYLYRRLEQMSPIISYSLTFAESEQTVELADEQIALRPAVYPANVTDRRIDWTSSNTDVADVHNGLVTLNAVGETTITARTHDGGAEASMKLIVVDSTSGVKAVNAIESSHSAVKTIVGNHLYIIKDGTRYTIDGQH